ncbi:hypothetical protein ACFV0L_43990, partial [Streptosporangium canum]
MGHVTEPADRRRRYGGAGAPMHVAGGGVAAAKRGISRSERGRILRVGVVAAGLLASVVTTSAASAQAGPAASAQAGPAAPAQAGPAAPAQAGPAAPAQSGP